MAYLARPVEPLGVVCVCELCERPIERPAANAAQFRFPSAGTKHLCPACIAQVASYATRQGPELLCEQCGEPGAFTRGSGKKFCDACLAAATTRPDDAAVLLEHDWTSEDGSSWTCRRCLQEVVLVAALTPRLWPTGGVCLGSVSASGDSDRYIDIDQRDLRPENWDPATQSCRRHGERRCGICLGLRRPRESAKDRSHG